MTDDSARDLFGYSPRRAIICEGCGLWAEPHTGRFCWCCAHNGQMRLVLQAPTVTETDRKILTLNPKRIR